MRTLVHLSDLHFGRVDPGLLDPLVNAVQAIEPDLVTVSGDLTQRARSSQFAAARAFLDRLPTPQIVVPGNHDVPLYDVVRRFASPLARYRRYIADDLEPWFVDDEIGVVGINTSRSLTFKEGRINELQIDRVRQRLLGLPDGVMKVVVTHHPVDLPAAFSAHGIVGRAALAREMLAACGCDLVLAGHLHRSIASEGSARADAAAHEPVVVQAGTATSTRGRGEYNSFNVIVLDPGRIEVTHYRWLASEGVFAPGGGERFARSTVGWRRRADPATDAAT